MRIAHPVYCGMHRKGRNIQNDNYILHVCIYAKFKSTFVYRNSVDQNMIIIMLLTNKKLQCDKYSKFMFLIQYNEHTYTHTVCLKPLKLIQRLIVQNSKVEISFKFHSRGHDSIDTFYYSTNG